jgi:hypothetical protein
MMVVVFALIVPTTTTITTDTVQAYSVQWEEQMLHNVTKFLQGVTRLASSLGSSA